MPAFAFIRAVAKVRTTSIDQVDGTLRHRLFGMGKFRPGQTAILGSPGQLAAAQGISVTSTKTDLKLPGQNTNSGIRLMVGAVVLLPDRALVSIGRLELHAELRHSEGGTSPAILSVDDQGIRIQVDVARLVAGGSGRAEVFFRVPLSAPTLGALVGTSGDVALNPVSRQQLSRKL